MESDKDHIHLLVSYESKISIPMIAPRLKTETAGNAWKAFDAQLRHHFWRELTFWSDSYFACSVGDASTDTMREYIESQN